MFEWFEGFEVGESIRRMHSPQSQDNASFR